jgi:DMSO/TMAO reductase YedYZ molybdopterin-dependent catalytic subunit
LKAKRLPAALPPGQRLVSRMPLRHVGEPPPFDGRSWSLALMGEVARPAVFSLEDLQRMSTVELEADFHAGAGWSVARVRWRGVRLADLLVRAGPLEEARFVRFSDGMKYDTTLALADALAADNLLATGFGDAPLEATRGGPLRLVVPAKYGRKSLKWLRSIELMREDRPGFWERRGFHAGADPWKAERLA